MLISAWENDQSPSSHRHQRRMSLQGLIATSTPMILLLLCGNRVESGFPKELLDRKPELRIPVPIFVVQGLPTNISGPVGSTVQLPCRAQHLGNRAISWIRSKDLHVLTSGTFTYTSDSRFHVVHPEKSNEWHLSISRINESDAGVYECQINTEPKKSFSVTLHVTSLSTRILGPNEIYVEEGSPVNLTCQVRGSAGESLIGPNVGPKQTVTWLLDGRSLKRSVVVKEQTVGADASEIVSNLLIPRAMSKDSGKYVCSKSGSNSWPVTVHVLIGENSAAMQRESSVSRASQHRRLEVPASLLTLSTYLVSAAVTFGSQGCPVEGWSDLESFDGLQRVTRR